MLVIAYPNENQVDATFTFEYWIDGYSPSIFEKLAIFLKKGQNLVIFILAILLVLMALISTCIFFRRWKNKVIITPKEYKEPPKNINVETNTSNIPINNESATIEFESYSPRIKIKN